ncbi:MAG: PIN domain-containing protein [Bacteroidota bacterium]
MTQRAFFLDTAYAYALVNKSDAWHSAAVEWQNKIVHEGVGLCTTEYVLCEIADGLSSLKFHKKTFQLISVLEESPLITVIPASTELFHKGFQLFEHYEDKEWSLTDCISFVVMRKYKLNEALTTDIHFQQAGFRALLREK